VYEVTDRLLFSDIRQAADPELYRMHDVDTVVKLTHQSPYDEPTGGYPDRVEVFDHPLIDGPKNDRADMKEAVEVAASALSDGKVVLVHCSAGMSRSPAVTAAALARHRGIEFTEALEKVRDTRDVNLHPAVKENAVFAAEC